MRGQSIRCSWSSQARRPSRPAQDRQAPCLTPVADVRTGRRGRHMTEPDHLPSAAEAALAARDALHGASRRRADATAAAQQLIDNALVTEKAEKDAARSALTASIRRLGAEEVPVEEIAELCDMPSDSVRVLIDRPTADIQDGMR